MSFIPQSNPTIPEKMLRVDDVAHVMGVGERSVWNWTMAEELSYFKRGGVVRFHPEAVADFIVRHTIAAKPRPPGARLAEEDVELLWQRMQRLLQTQMREAA